MMFRGAFKNGLFWHTVPLKTNGTCSFIMQEANHLIALKTIKNLETTQAMTNIKIDYFNILINLNKHSPSFAIPNFSFKYNATLHLKGSSSMKKKIFIFSNSTF